MSRPASAHVCVCFLVEPRRQEDGTVKERRMLSPRVPYSIIGAVEHHLHTVCAFNALAEYPKVP